MNRKFSMLGLVITLAVLAVVGILSLLTRDSGTSLNPILTAHFIDVGQGDSILLQAGEMNVLIDAGDREMGARVLRYLRDHGVRSIDLFIATHPHADHIGGALTVLDGIPVRRIIDSGQVHTTQTFSRYLRLVEAKNIPFEIAKSQVIALAGNVSLRIMGPLRKYGELNDGSVVVLVTAGDVSVLLTGDIEEAAEKDLTQAGGIRAQVLKVGHHGSNTSSTTAFLQAVRPRVAIISVGEGNSYGHPASATLSRLRDIGAHIYRTDLHGSIVLFTDGESFSIRTERKSP